VTTWTCSALSRTNSRSSRVTDGAIHAAGAGPSARDPPGAPHRAHLSAAPMGNIRGLSTPLQALPQPKPSPHADTRIMRNPHRLQVPWGAPAESAESPGNTGQGPAERRPDRHVLRSCNATAYSAVEQRYNLLGCGPFGRLVVISRSLHDLDAPAAGVNFGSDYRGAPGTHERRQIIALLTVGPLRSGPTFNACEVPDR
jgi:hypothetical protein